MIRISKGEWTALGGLTNPKLWRRVRNGRYQYFKQGKR